RCSHDCLHSTAATTRGAASGRGVGDHRRLPICTLPKVRQHVSLFFANALELGRPDRECVQDGGGDLPSLNPLLYALARKPWVRNQEGDISVVLREAAMLSKLRPARIDQTMIGDGDEIRRAVVPKRIAERFRELVLIQDLHDAE